MVDLVELTKQISILKKEISVHEAEVRRLQATLIERQADVNKAVMIASMAIHSLKLGRSNSGEDTIFLEDDDSGRGLAQRRTLGDIANRLRLLYIVDPIEPVSQEIMQVIERETPGWNQDTEELSQAN